MNPLTCVKEHIPLSFWTAGTTIFSYLGYPIRWIMNQSQTVEKIDQTARERLTFNRKTLTSLNHRIPLLDTKNVTPLELLNFEKKLAEEMKRYLNLDKVNGDPSEIQLEGLNFLDYTIDNWYLENDRTEELLLQNQPVPEQYKTELMDAIQKQNLPKLTELLTTEKLALWTVFTLFKEQKIDHTEYATLAISLNAIKNFPNAVKKFVLITDCKELLGETVRDEALTRTAQFSFINQLVLMIETEQDLPTLFSTTYSKISHLFNIYDGKKISIASLKLYQLLHKIKYGSQAAKFLVATDQTSLATIFYGHLDRIRPVFVPLPWGKERYEAHWTSAPYEIAIHDVSFHGVIISKLSNEQIGKNFETAMKLLSLSLANQKEPIAFHYSCRESAWSIVDVGLWGCDSVFNYNRNNFSPEAILAYTKILNDYNTPRHSQSS